MRLSTGKLITQLGLLLCTSMGTVNAQQWKNENHQDFHWPDSLPLPEEIPNQKQLKPEKKPNANQYQMPVYKPDTFTQYHLRKRKPDAQTHFYLRNPGVW